jgi:hypothetical protein
MENVFGVEEENLLDNLYTCHIWANKLGASVGRYGENLIQVTIFRTWRRKYFPLTNSGIKRACEFIKIATQNLNKKLPEFK